MRFFYSYFGLRLTWDTFPIRAIPFILFISAIELLNETNKVDRKII